MKTRLANDESGCFGYGTNGSSKKCEKAEQCFRYVGRIEREKLPEEKRQYARFSIPVDVDECDFYWEMY